jgi:ornithine cyclodeaminase/alanine dehydrogenase-like protein (mu-crystallin family)
MVSSKASEWAGARRLHCRSRMKTYDRSQSSDRFGCKPVKCDENRITGSATDGTDDMLIIDNALVSKLLTMEDCIRVQEEAFAKLLSGGAMHRPRVDMYFPCNREDGYFRWGSMEGANDGYFAIRMKSDIVTWPRDANGNWTEDKYCRQPGTYCGIIFLVSTCNAEPLAFINDGVLQHMRVGGGAGLGAKYLARADAHVVGMFGSGGMAHTFLEALSVSATYGCAKSTARRRRIAKRSRTKCRDGLTSRCARSRTRAKPSGAPTFCPHARTACSRSMMPTGSRKACM